MFYTFHYDLIPLFIKLVANDQFVVLLSTRFTTATITGATFPTHDFDSGIQSTIMYDNPYMIF